MTNNLPGIVFSSNRVSLAPWKQTGYERVHANTYGVQHFRTSLHLSHIH